MTSDLGYTPLMYALTKSLQRRDCLSRYVTIVKLLLGSEKTRLDIKDINNRPALLLADYLEGFKLLTADAGAPQGRG